MSPQLALVANAEADEDAREGSLSDQRCLLRDLEHRHPRHRTDPVGTRLRLATITKNVVRPVLRDRPQTRGAVFGER